MKRLLIIITLMICGLAQSQNVASIFKEKLQPRKSTQTVKEGLAQVTKLCAVTPEEKCIKAKAVANYLLADDYYSAAYQVALVDQELSIPILKVANRYFKTANTLKSIEEFKPYEKHMMLEARTSFEADEALKKLLLVN